LPFLRSAGQQNHKLIAILPAIHPVSRAVVNTKLEHAGANCPMVADFEAISASLSRIEGT